MFRIKFRTSKIRRRPHSHGKKNSSCGSQTNQVGPQTNTGVAVVISCISSGVASYGALGHVPSTS